MPIEKVSVIIPTLNEQKILPQLFSNLKKLEPQPEEVIFVDGPSKDETSCMIEQEGFKLIKVAGKGRSLQMNEGAYQASGKLLVFLHADTKVPENLVHTVSETMQDGHVTLAGFTTVRDGYSKWKKIIIFRNKLLKQIGSLIYSPIRCVCFGFRLIFGEQVMFCRKSDFLKIGGFNNDMPILEDVDLCLRINRLGGIKQLSDEVYTSDRKQASLGVFRAYFNYVRTYFLWRLGASTHWLIAQDENIR